ncbi:MAG: XRE family transcriptional regulator [Candidatus Electrothrix sp. AR4]|nr:XRE family transcriptional regulator [Candidatus Electrothrix sp. AR4]
MINEIPINRAAANLGLRLRQARIEAQLTQAMLAARAGLSVRVIGRMEQGDVTVSLGRWLKASAVLNLVDSWESALLIPEDPFTQYDREQNERVDISRRRVRPGRNS